MWAMLVPAYCFSAHLGSRSRTCIRNNPKVENAAVGTLYRAVRGCADRLCVHFWLMLEGEIPDVGPLPGMLNRHGNQVSILV